MDRLGTDRHISIRRNKDPHLDRKFLTLTLKGNMAKVIPRIRLGMRPRSRIMIRVTPLRPIFNNPSGLLGQLPNLGHLWTKCHSLNFWHHVLVDCDKETAYFTISDDQ